MSFACMELSFGLLNDEGEVEEEGSDGHWGHQRVGSQWGVGVQRSRDKRGIHQRMGNMAIKIRHGERWG